MIDQDSAFFWGPPVLRSGRHTAVTGQRFSWRLCRLVPGLELRLPTALLMSRFPRRNASCLSLLKHAKTRVPLGKIAQRSPILLGASPALAPSDRDLHRPPEVRTSAPIPQTPGATIRRRRRGHTLMPPAMLPK